MCGYLWRTSLLPQSTPGAIKHLLRERGGESDAGRGYLIFTHTIAHNVDHPQSWRNLGQLSISIAAKAGLGGPCGHRRIHGPMWAAPCARAHVGSTVNRDSARAHVGSTVCSPRHGSPAAGPCGQHRTLLPTSAPRIILLRSSSSSSSAPPPPHPSASRDGLGRGSPRRAVATQGKGTALLATWAYRQGPPPHPLPLRSPAPRCRALRRTVRALTGELVGDVP
jgi:hypothetical protein